MSWTALAPSPRFGGSRTGAILSQKDAALDRLATLVRGGFATERTDRVRAGAEWIEVRSLRISDAGRRVIGRR